MRFLAALLVLGFVLAFPSCDQPEGVGTQETVPTTRVRNRHPVYTVIASNAPTWMRRGGPNTWLCSGTQAAGGDQVQIQAAIDAAATAGNGIVELSLGAFFAAKPSGAVDIRAVDCDVTLTGSTLVVDNFTSWSAGAITDVAVGQVYRLTGGDDGEGNSLEDNKEELIATVTAADATSVTFGNAVVAEEGDPDYTGVEMVRMIGCINLKQGVTLRGAGINATLVTLANSQDCCIATGEEYSAGANLPYCAIEKIKFSGNDANQSQGHADSPANGIIFNESMVDVHIRDVALVSCEDDGWWFCNPWGLQISGGWTEYCDGKGIALGNGGPSTIRGHKILTCEEEGLFLRRSGFCTVSDCYIGSNSDWAVYCRIGASHRFVGNHLVSDDSHGTPLGALYCEAPGSTIEGNTFDADQANTPAISIQTQPLAVIGNSFNLNCDRPLDVGYIANWNNIQGNLWCFGYDSLNSTTDLRVDAKQIRCKNTSGSSIGYLHFVKRNTQPGTIQACALSNTEKPLGMVGTTLADNATGPILLYGYSNEVAYDNVDDDPAIAIGDPLCLSDDRAGALEAAGDGDWVVAICEEAYDPPGAGTYTERAAYILPPSEQYTLGNDGPSYRMAGEILEDATTPPLVLAWVSPATTETDLSGNSNDATYSNFATTDQLPKGTVWALNFYDGNDEYLTVSDDAAFSWDDTGANPFSVCAWIQVVATAATQTIIAKYDVQNTDREWSFAVNSSEQLVCAFFDEADDKACSNTTDAALTAGWHFVVHTYDSTGGAAAMSDANSVWYVDGVAVAESQTNDADYTGMVAGATDVTIGANNTGAALGNHFQGDMGIVWIEDVELSAAAVWQYYISTRGYYAE